MLILEDVLTAEEVAAIQTALSEAEFEDGRATAKGAAADVKHNLQAARDGNTQVPLDDLVIGALTRQKQFRNWAFPARFALPLYSNYEPGMAYGAHTDAAIMGKTQPMRTDVSITVFLNDPESYDGRELHLENDSGGTKVKLPAGHAVAYNTTAIHQVMPVTRGERLVAVTWAQSFVVDPGMRRILYDMNRVCAKPKAVEPNSEESRMLQNCYHNPLRRFSAPQSSIAAECEGG
ncbi:UNVERIFIED_CONTAM: hypothetical protein GTU68_032166 [Idotea baltica]|nr:hypothetical protein [Idotea baltica]